MTAPTLAEEWGAPVVGALGRLAFALLAAGLVVFLLAPIVVIVPLSLSAATYLQFPPRAYSTRWYVEFFGSDAWRSAAITSVEVAMATMLLATVLGTAAAFGLWKARWRAKGLVKLLLLAPRVVPAIVIAIAVYRLYAEFRLVGTPLGLTLGHTGLALPFVMATVLATLQGLDPNLERAALGLGARPLRAFAEVIFPLIRPGIVSGALLAFVISFDEVVIAIFLGGATAATLPKKMWEYLQVEMDPTIAAASVVQICASLLCFVAIALSRHRWRRGGEP